MSSTPRLPLYFWHIPKTAGTSFTGWLESHFDAHEVFGPHLLPDLRSAGDPGVRGKQLFRGHFGAELPQRLPTPVTSLVLLREPRARTVSHLSHIWRAPDHYLHERIRGTRGDLRAVFADDVLRTSVTDMQARYLALDPVGTERMRLPVTVPAAQLGQAQYELTPLPAPQLTARRAWRQLLALSGFGFTEDLDGFATRVAARLGWAAPEPLSRANAKPSGSSPWSLGAMGTADLQVIDRLNPVDGPLYRRARQAATPSPWLRRVVAPRRRPAVERPVAVA